MWETDHWNVKRVKLELSEEEEEEDIPEHSFDIKTSIGKTGAMKGKKRETVTLQLGNYNFRKRFVLKNGNINFTCTGCEGQVPKVNLSALAKINEEGKYELLYWPHSKEHSCWADQTDALIAKARREMYVQLSHVSMFLYLDLGLSINMARFLLYIFNKIQSFFLLCLR